MLVGISDAQHVWYMFCHIAHMGQFLQGGKNGRLMSFFLKVEPLCDQT